MLDIYKPGRYIDKEWNAVHKEWESSILKVALCFPDIYEIGMSHLGMKILYGILNQEEGVLCERVFAPWGDMEKKIRVEKKMLSSLESERPLKDFDIIGFSLQYEMNFVDALNMLDLGKIPLRSSDRGGSDPLVIAGGPCVFNPEPMSEFIDAFVIGEGEEAILEIASLVKCAKCNVSRSRAETLRELSKIKGVYVPRDTRYEIRDKIEKRIISDLDNAFFPTDQVVPYIQIVHDRIGIEIMRGCPHECRFCQACKISQPLRIRSVEKILEIAEASVKNTGYEEISLLSLSTGDYPYLEELIIKLEERFKPLGIKISLPSLRVKSFTGNKLKSVIRRAGLTFAPEAGSDELRERLNKNIKNEEIIQRSNLAFELGWKKVKLYFMLGLPGETDEDIDAIAALALKIKNASLSVSPFIPKPHSGFEKEGMDSLDMLREKKKRLMSGVNRQASGRKIKIDFHNPEMSKVEAVLSRGDSKIGTVIHKAWEKGARLQAWGEYFDYKLWEECFEACDIDPETYLKKKEKGKSSPWSFINAI